MLRWKVCNFDTDCGQCGTWGDLELWLSILRHCGRLNRKCHPATSKLSTLRAEVEPRWVDFSQDVRLLLRAVGARWVDNEVNMHECVSVSSERPLKGGGWLVPLIVALLSATRHCVSSLYCTHTVVMLTWVNSLHTYRH